MRKITFASLALLLLSSLAGCSGGDDSAQTIRFVAANIKLYEDTTKILAEELEKQGYKLEYKFISDNTQLNEAVISGEADANYHQHIAYLTEFNALHKSNLVPAFEAFTDPSGLFSKKHASLADLPDGAVISIPVDPANNFRTLVMLAKEGLLTLREGVEPAKATQRDIVDNPHHFTFREVDYALLTRALDDADAGFLYATLAAEIGLSFKEDALIQEDKALWSPDIIAVREEDKGSAKIKALKQAYQSDRIKQAFKDAYDGKEVLIPAW